MLDLQYYFSQAASTCPRRALQQWERKRKRRLLVGRRTPRTFSHLHSFRGIKDHIIDDLGTLAKCQLHWLPLRCVRGSWLTNHVSGWCVTRVWTSIRRKMRGLSLMNIDKLEVYWTLKR